LQRDFELAKKLKFEILKKTCKLQRVFVEVANCSEISDRLQIAASFRAG
jgi:hypothetical protein